MDTKEALKIVGRQAPCPHQNVDTGLGDGRTWAKCDDCGETVAQERLPMAQQTADAFDAALDLLGTAVQQAATPDTQALRLELSKLERQYRKSETLRECLVQEVRRLEDRLRGLELRQFKTFAGDECWIWQGDGSDQLETLMCPVVISAADLKQLVDKANAAQPED